MKGKFDTRFLKSHTIYCLLKQQCIQVGQHIEDAMEKATIFISHSGKDKLPLIAFKNMLERAFPDLMVFLSSDGESIKLGKNWSYEVEKALKDSVVAIIVLTENSYENIWVHFEAGYMFSNENLEIIPVIFGALEPKDLRPPLSLFQSIHLNNENGLIRIQKIIESNLGKKSSYTFAASDYNELIKSSRLSRELDSTFHEIEIQITGNIDSAYQCMKRELNNVYDIRRLNSDGDIQRYMWPGGVIRYQEDVYLSFTLSHLKSFESLQIFNSNFAKFAKLSTKIRTTVKLPQSYRTWDRIHDLYAIIDGSSISMLDDETLSYNGLKFSISNISEYTENMTPIHFGVSISILDSKFGLVIPTHDYIKKLVSTLLELNAITNSEDV